jgi:hypothetical protein
MLRRQRDARPSWPLEVTEPAAGNFYPITSAAAILGRRRGAGGRCGGHGGGGGGAEGAAGCGCEEGALAVSVATDRAQGAASLADGQLEVMLHRCGIYVVFVFVCIYVCARSTNVCACIHLLFASFCGGRPAGGDMLHGWGRALPPSRGPCGCVCALLWRARGGGGPSPNPAVSHLRRGRRRRPRKPQRTTAADDLRGVGENLNETMCGARGSACGGLVARGTFLLTAGPAAAAGRAARGAAALLNDPPELAFARVEVAAAAAAAAEPPPTGGAREGGGGGGAGGAAGGGASGAGAVVAAALRSGRLRGRWSGLAGGAPLAPNVQLVTLMRPDEGDGGRAIVRLGHAFQASGRGAFIRGVT